MTGEKITAQMTDAQYADFMASVKAHHVEMQGFARAQAESARRALELIAEAVKAQSPNRDWFAGLALAGQDVGTGSPDTTAAWAYKIADAMLKARAAE